MSLRFGPIVLAATLFASACTAPKVVAPISPAEVGPISPGSGYLKGYLATSELPDSLALVPVPPATGSAAQSSDDASFLALTRFQSTARGTQAVKDADLTFPSAADAFSCALGMPISEQSTPNLNMLLRRTLADAGLSTYKAKNKYQRTRPFMVFKVPSCTPSDDVLLAKDGSYPSGHSAIGWAWALVLTELAPERADALLQRGRAFGQSRGICGVHWLSDIESGRLMGAAAVARLHSNPLFMAQLEASRGEIAKARAADARPNVDCAAEEAALAASGALAP